MPEKTPERRLLGRSESEAFYWESVLTLMPTNFSEGLNEMVFSYFSRTDLAYNWRLYEKKLRLLVAFGRFFQCTQTVQNSFSKILQILKCTVRSSAQYANL